MDEDEKRAIKKMWEPLCDQMDWKQVAPRLITKSLLSSRDYENIAVSLFYYSITGHCI